MKSSRWIDTVRQSVREAVEAAGMVNVTVVAREICAMHPHVPLLEIEHAVLAFADLMGVAIVFDGGRANQAPSHPIQSHPLVIEFITVDGREIGDGSPNGHSLDGYDTSPSEA